MSTPGRLSELTFQLIVESTPNAIVLVNKEGKIAYLNSQTEALFGYTRSELIGQRVELLMPSRYRGEHPDFRTAFFMSPSVRAMGAGRELFAIKKDGTEFPIEIGLNPVVTIEGTMVLASIIDITERKRAEEGFRLVVESAPNAMLLINRAGTITLMNNQAEAYFGYTRDELVGRPLETLIPERFRRQHPDQRRSFYAQPRARAMGVGRDLYARRKDGTEFPVEIGLNPINSGDAILVLASIIDITERKAAEELIRAQVYELAQKNKELEQFAYIASHDLQEPLRTVTNYIGLLQEDYSDQLDATAHRLLKTIMGASVRMRVLIQALLAFSKLGRNKAVTTFETAEVLRQVLEDSRASICETGATVVCSDLPRIDGYELEFRQLLQNLLANAIKFRRPDEDPAIAVRAVRRSDSWEFQVEDNGIGIDPKYHDKIFHIFQRLHTDDTYEGFGIGLANCKKIVDLHRGKIWVVSDGCTGTTVHFTVSNALGS